MSFLKTLILILLPILVFGQLQKPIVIQEPHDLVLGMKFPEDTWKDWKVRGSLMFLNGFADGFHDGLHYRYDNFKKRFPNANDRYWNPKTSWRNKWWHGDPANGDKFFGSSTFLVWTTDASHLTKSVRMTSGLTAVSFPLFSKPKKWYYYLADMVVFWGFRQLGFHASYSLIFNGQNP